MLICLSKCPFLLLWVLSSLLSLGRTRALRQLALVFPHSHISFSGQRWVKCRAMVEWPKSVFLGHGRSLMSAPEKTLSFTPLRYITFLYRFLPTTLFYMVLDEPVLHSKTPISEKTERVGILWKRASHVLPSGLCVLQCWSRCLNWLLPWEIMLMDFSVWHACSPGICFALVSPGLREKRCFAGATFNFSRRTWDTLWL